MHRFVVGIVIPLLGYVGFVCTFEVFEADIINASLPWLVFIMFIDLESEV